MSFINVYWGEKEFRDHANYTAELVGKHKTEQPVPTPTLSFRKEVAFHSDRRGHTFEQGSLSRKWAGTGKTRSYPHEVTVRRKDEMKTQTLLLWEISPAKPNHKAEENSRAIH